VIAHGERPPPAALTGALRRSYGPNRVALILGDAALRRHAGRVPWLDGKGPLGGRATAFVCERGRCELPTSDPPVFGRQLRRVEALEELRPLALETR